MVHRAFRFTSIERTIILRVITLGIVILLFRNFTVKKLSKLFLREVLNGL